MKAILMAVGEPGGELPLFLAPLLDRPFLQHVVEYLVDHGAESLEVVLSEHPERVESLLGDGSRWGTPVRYHLARDARRAYAAAAAAAGGEPALLACADRLPQVDPATGREPPENAAWMSGEQWTGWAWLGGGPYPVADFEDWPRSGARRVPCGCVLGARSQTELLESRRAVLTKQFEGLWFSGREVQEGVWIARNVSLHPTAAVEPPVYLGENSRVGAGARIGPCAVVMRDCILDRHSTVAHSAILPGSYVGEALELEHVVVDRNRLVNVKLGGETTVRDDFILGSLAGSRWGLRARAVVSRALGALLLAAGAPLLALTAAWLRLFRAGPVVFRREVVSLPAPEAERDWRRFGLCSFEAGTTRGAGARHLFLHVLPGLAHVVRGEIGLTGVAARTPAQIAALPHDWRTLYLRARAGLITEADVLYGARPNDDEQYSSEAFYSVAAGARHDAWILLRYAGRLLAPSGRARQHVQHPDAA